MRGGGKGKIKGFRVGIILGRRKVGDQRIGKKNTAYTSVLVIITKFKPFTHIKAKYYITHHHLIN